MNPEIVLKNLVTPTSFAIMILGSILIFITRKSLNKILLEAAIEIKGRFFNFSRNNQEQLSTGKDEKNEFEKIKKFYSDLKLKNFDEFNQALNDYVKESEQNRKEVQETKERITNIFELWKYYMFSYFNLILVPNTKIALLWFYNNANSTKDMGKMNIQLSSQVENSELEKEAIFNALLGNYLLEKDDRDLYKASRIGEDFLRFIGFIK